MSKLFLRFSIILLLKTARLKPVETKLYGHNPLYWGDSVQFSSVAQSWPTLCDPMNLSTPGLPVHYQLLESTQTHVH